tara:strand:- start:83 stop:523 length:441 start_codon:yes stop_codon:yes gene_type:complete
MDNYYKQESYSSKKQMVNGELVEAKDLHYLNDNGKKELLSSFLDKDGKIKHIHISHPTFQRLSRSNKKSLTQRLIEDFDIGTHNTHSTQIQSNKKKKKTKKIISFRKILSFSKGKKKKTKRPKRFINLKKTKRCRTKSGKYTKCKK